MARRHKTEPPPLTAREIRFCQLWVEHGNGTRSYIDAGFPHKTENVAAQMARRLFRKVQIREYIRELQHAAADAAKVTVALIAQGLYRDGWADRRGFFGPDGEVLPPSQWPADLAATVVGVEVEELEDFEPDPDRPGKKRKVKIGQKWKVKTTDRLSARKTLAQWKGMLSDEQLKALDKLVKIVSGVDKGQM